MPDVPKRKARLTDGSTIESLTVVIISGKDTLQPVTIELANLLHGNSTFDRGKGAAVWYEMRCTALVPLTVAHTLGDGDIIPFVLGAMANITLASERIGEREHSGQLAGARVVQGTMAIDAAPVIGLVYELYLTFGEAVYNA